MKRTGTLIARIVVPASFIALAIGSNRSISIQAWLAATAVWLAGVMLWDLIVAARVEQDERIPVWRVKDEALRRRAPEGMSLASTLITSAERLPRVHAIRLRPRLLELSNHYVPVNHGFSPEVAPHRMARLLGDDAWLLDPNVTDRTPTQAEVSRFLDAVLGTTTQER